MSSHYYSPFMILLLCIGDASDFGSTEPFWIWRENKIEAELARRRMRVEKLHAILLNLCRQLEISPSASSSELRQFFSIDSFRISHANFSELRDACEMLGEERNRIVAECDQLQNEIVWIRQLQLNKGQFSDFEQNYFGRYFLSSKEALEPELGRLNKLNRLYKRYCIDKTWEDIREEQIKCRLVKIGEIPLTPVEVNGECWLAYCWLCVRGPNFGYLLVLHANKNAEHPLEALESQLQERFVSQITSCLTCWIIWTKCSLHL